MVLADMRLWSEMSRITPDLSSVPVTQCQQPATGLKQQLLDGIRFIDVRLKVVGEDLLGAFHDPAPLCPRLIRNSAYHGSRPQRATFTDILSTLHCFLELHPTETFIMSIKEEIPPFHPRFSELVYAAMMAYRDDWFLDDRVPKLGEVRGKGILFSRFEKANEKEWIEGMGIHPYTWPDSRREGFEWNCDGTIVRTQDWSVVSPCNATP